MPYIHGNQIHRGARPRGRPKGSRAGRRVAVWVREEMDEWKNQTELTWSEILRAGVEALSRGGVPIYQHGTLGDIERRLDFFIKKTQELRHEIDRRRENGEKKRERTREMDP